MSFPALISNPLLSPASVPRSGSTPQTSRPFTMLSSPTVTPSSPHRSTALSVGHSPSPTPTATRSLSTTAPDGPNATGRSPSPEDRGCARGRLQQRPLTVASQHDRQHTRLAGTTAKRPAAPLVRDEEAAGSNPATPTIKLYVTACFRSQFRLRRSAGLRVWERTGADLVRPTSLTSGNAPLCVRRVGAASEPPS